MLPENFHNVMLPYARNLARVPLDTLPRWKKAFDALSCDDVRAAVRARLQAGADALLDSAVKHVSWVYKGFGLILHICSPGNAGSVARAITAACDDVVFGAHAQKKAAAQLAVQEHATSECDIFWKKAVTADNSSVAHWLQQLHLVKGDTSEEEKLTDEWLALCRHNCTNSHDDPVIRIEFPAHFKILHRRLCLFVDTIKSDSLMDEANFNVKSWLHVKQSLSTSQDNAVWWDRQMMAPLKELGRAAGERQKTASRAAKEFTFVGPSTKAPETSASDWCHTNMQCRAVCRCY